MPEPQALPRRAARVRGVRDVRALAAAMPEPVVLTLLFSLAAGLSSLTAFHGINQNDEGLMLQPAARIAAGEVPYRDFFLFHAPGQPYLLAGLWKLFGASLVPWRILRLVTNAAVAVLAYKLARRHAPPRLALAAWVVAAGAMAAPNGPNPHAIALAFALAALIAIPRAPLAAGVLAGLCAAWRVDFALYLWLGIAIACLAGGRRDALARFLGAAVLTGAALLAPVLLMAGLADPWQMLVRHPLEYVGDQALPLSLRYGGELSGAVPWGLRDSAAHLLLFYLPVALLVGTAAALGVLATGFTRERWPTLAVGVFTIGAAHYLLIRADEYHTAPLAVMFGIVAAWAIARGRPAAARRVWVVPAAVTAVVLVATAWQGLDRSIREAQTAHVPIRLTVADGVQGLASGRCSYRSRPLATCRLVDLERAVRYVQGRVPPGRAIYVATRRSDLVTSGAPLFYVLAQRPNPTRYDILPPRLVTSAPVQREIVRDLEQNGLPLVVRWAAPITTAPEPNGAGRSSGVRLLDDFLAENYRQAARFGSYLILESGVQVPPRPKKSGRTAG